MEINQKTKRDINHKKWLDMILKKCSLQNECALLRTYEIKVIEKEKNRIHPSSSL